MTERDERGMPRRRILTGALALVTAAAAFALVLAPQPTTAAWVRAKSVAITASAVTPAAVPTVTCGASSGLLNALIPINFTAPPGPTPSRYRVSWTGGAGSGTVYTTTSPAQINASSISVAGTSVVTVYPEYGDWTVTPASAQTVKFTTVAVVVVVSWTCGPNP